MESLPNLKLPIFTILWVRHLPLEPPRICSRDVFRVPLDILCVSDRACLLYTRQQSLMNGLSGPHLAFRIPSRGIQPCATFLRHFYRVLVHFERRSEMQTAPSNLHKSSDMLSGMLCDAGVPCGTPASAPIPTSLHLANATSLYSSGNCRGMNTYPARFVRLVMLYHAL